MGRRAVQICRAACITFACRPMLCATPRSLIALLTCKTNRGPLSHRCESPPSCSRGALASLRRLRSPRLQQGWLFGLRQPGIQPDAPVGPKDLRRNRRWALTINGQPNSGGGSNSSQIRSQPSPAMRGGCHRLLAEAASRATPTPPAHWAQSQLQAQKAQGSLLPPPPSARAPRTRARQQLRT